jgi:thiamine kinase-like enzyme
VTIRGVGETKVVSIPLGDGVFSSAWLSSVLEESPHWPHGPVRVLRVSQIGTEYGLSGQIHRVVAETKHGGSRSFVVKQESAAAVERELLFRRHCGALVRGCIPDLLCGVTDAGADRGILVLEDITPAEQGDVLHGCTDEEAGAVVRVLARLHGGSWNTSADAFTADLPRWSPQPMEPDRWRDRLARATERFPEILERLVEPLLDVPERVADAASLLSQGPASWLHVDAHLDNTLLRPDGTVVLVDWCNAAIGPPAIDLARFLIEGVVESSQPERVTALLSVYANERRRAGVEGVALPELETGFELALLPLLQGAVSWAGRHNLEQNGRSAALCENFLRSACGWALGDESGSQHGSKAP